MRYNSSFSSRALLWAFTVALALGAAGCSSETKERKSFMDFLQQRIIEKPGVHVPRLVPEEEKSFGQYSKHYAVIREFNDAMDTKISGPMRDMMSKGMPRSVQDLMTRRADLATMRTATGQLRTSIEAELAKADAQRAALKQPDDLKAVYDKAYARTVTEPAKLVTQFMPAVESTLQGAEEMAAFLEQHKDQITFNGSMLQVNDPKLLEQANALLAKMNARSGEVMDAQRKMNSMISGK